MHTDFMAAKGPNGRSRVTGTLERVEVLGRFREGRDAEVVDWRQGKVWGEKATGRVQFVQRLAEEILDCPRLGFGKRQRPLGELEADGERDPALRVLPLEGGHEGCGVVVVHKCREHTVQVETFARTHGQ